MENGTIIHLDSIKTSFYEKGIDLVNVHLYVRDVEENEILFEENKVTCKFSTKNPRFIKLHAEGGRGKHAFCYIINTKEAIDPTGCYYNVKGPFIEVILKKKVARKWQGLHLPPIELNGHVSPKLASEGKKKMKSHPKRPNESQLLGGKSTPVVKTTDENKQDADLKLDNRVTSTNKTEDERNIKKAAQQPEYIAGLTGLENYANNCYMNVVIQILANIQETRDYFRNDHYLKDINVGNPLSSGGKVVKAFADVIKALWSARKNAFKPSALKNIMGKRYSLFLGWQQHDAQEFFSSLLDNLHEDLNHQAQCEKGAEKEKENKVEIESTVNEKPDTAWTSHVKRNNSFIVKLFHGQLMSKLTCAACHKVSYSYDPCAQISLPIPTVKKLHLRILFFSRDVNKTPLMVSMQISTPNAKVWHLKHMLQTLVKVPSHLISVFNGNYNVCVDDQTPVMAIRKYKYIIASEISAKDEVEFISIPVLQYVYHSGQFIHCDNCFTLQNESVNLKRCTRCLAVAYCTRECQTKHWHDIHSKICMKDLKMQVGLPFYVTLRKDTLTFEALEECLRDRAKVSVEMFSSNTTDEIANIDVVTDDKSENDNLGQNLSVASSASCVIKVSNKPSNDDVCVTINSDNFSPDVLYKSSFIILEWQNSPEGDMSSNIRTKSVPVHEVFHNESNTGMSVEEDQCSIYDCLRLFMEPESLDKRDSWKCPKCKSLQSAKKEMAISSPPGLLLLHLKRFTYGDFGQKINKAVSYPLSNFDLSPFIARETQSRIDHPLVYDLCGVITHRGSMRMGHYTCLVRMLGMHDQEEIGWRYFDDDSVIKIGSDKVNSSDAYVLVYRIQGAREILKLGSIYSENLVKRKCSDASANSNVEKLVKADNAVAAECDLDSFKQSANSEEGQDDPCEADISPHTHVRYENKDSFNKPGLHGDPSLLNSSSDSTPFLNKGAHSSSVFSDMNNDFSNNPNFIPISLPECVNSGNYADETSSNSSFCAPIGNENGKLDSILLTSLSHESVNSDTPKDEGLLLSPTCNYISSEYDAVTTDGIPYIPNLHEFQQLNISHDAEAYTDDCQHQTLPSTDKVKKCVVESDELLSHNYSKFVSDINEDDLD